MSEEESILEIQKPRVMSRIARIAGIASFVGGFLIVPYTCSDAFVTSGEMLSECFLTHFALLVIYSGPYFLWPLFAISLILSIVTLFIERNIFHRLRPLILVLTGIFLYTSHLIILLFYFYLRMEYEIRKHS
jgi:hypothetical protein